MALFRCLAVFRQVFVLKNQKAALRRPNLNTTSRPCQAMRCKTRAQQRFSGRAVMAAGRGTGAMRALAQQRWRRKCDILDSLFLIIRENPWKTDPDSCR